MSNAIGVKEKYNSGIVIVRLQKINSNDYGEDRFFLGASQLFTLQMSGGFGIWYTKLVAISSLSALKYMINSMKKNKGIKEITDRENADTHLEKLVYA